MESDWRIISVLAGRYKLYRASTDETVWASARGIFRKQGRKPLPGDWVRVEASGDQDYPYQIAEIVARKNSLLRPPLANVDCLLLLAATAQPEPDFYLLDRLISYAYSRQLDVILVLTKTDLAGPFEAALRENYSRAVPNIFAVGADSSDRELAPLLALLKHRLSVLVGQSGVGKSTLLNRLLGDRLMETGSLSEKAGRGKQTTRHVEIFPRADFLLADSPGFQSFDPLQIGLSGEELLAGYPELLAIQDQCFFNNCRHLGERGCAVESAQLAKERLERYREMRRTIDEAAKRY